MSTKRTLRNVNILLKIVKTEDNLLVEGRNEQDCQKKMLTKYSFNVRVKHKLLYRVDSYRGGRKNHNR